LNVQNTSQAAAFSGAEAVGPVSEDELEEVLSRPTPESITAAAGLGGDLIVLGAGGKMGPSFARLVRRSLEACGARDRVICASRFSRAQVREQLEDSGIETIGCDLLHAGALESLPDAPNVAFMVGTKFGSSAALARTWAINAYVAGLVASRYRDSRIVCLSTGNVYPLVGVSTGGATEETAPAPVGEYAQSCLGRERLFEYAAACRGTRVLIARLNYASDLRYGVLVDIAHMVIEKQPVPLSIGYVNTIWQGDALLFILRSFELCSSPPRILNITGLETVSIRDVAHRFAELLGVAGPTFAGSEGAEALLSDATLLSQTFSPPRVTLNELVLWTADWVRRGLPTLGKPTRFEVSDGRF
jgi:nucleoside-diphosphate-sugar epimerase